MGELDDKLNAILSSPETMNQIMSIANAVVGEGSEQSPLEVAPAAPASESERAPTLSGLLGMLGGGGDSPSIDPQIINLVMRLAGEYNRSNDEKAILLQAMRPFLREEHANRIDRALQVTRLSRVIKTAMGLFRKEGGGDV